MDPQPPVELPGKVQHGGYTAWQRYKCRCEACLAHSRSANKRVRTVRDRKPVPEDVRHDLHAYNYYNCRCDECKAARTSYDRERYEHIRKTPEYKDKPRRLRK